MMINRYKIYSSNDDLSANNGKDRKSGYILPKDANSLISHVKNFYFTITFIAKSTS